ncbi:hypothetical protein [Haemophilus quentini]|nr:hypothetical protein [Haemophilus quentini]
MRLKMRKIVQIAVAECMAYDNDCGDLEQSETIVALCNDGTLWRRWLNTTGANRNEPKWVKIENVPQD